MSRPFRWVALTALAALAVTLVGLAAPVSAAVKYTPISGAGSTWSSNAIDQWKANVAKNGMKVNFQPTGSSDGRKQFANDTIDFGVSEIPYGLVDNGRRDDPPARKYAYMPIVAGGTSFMYNLKIGSKQVTNLRLSGETVTKIFTGNIKLWSDPQIKKDNPALSLPARKIIPVVRSDGSGTTAQFTLWMSKRYPALWNAYCSKAGRQSPCGITSNYPVVSGSGFTAQSGSLGVAGYVKQKSSEGAITYVEYSYPLNANFPVVKLLNDSGYYVLPTARNVAVGLLKATINENPSSPDYLTQNLTGVYGNKDRRAYPLSSYSYEIIPTKVEGSFSEAKGFTLAAFNKYVLCGGQGQAEDLGYSPLPINLVEAGFKQVRKIPGADIGTINVKSCNNPTFSADGGNTLAKTAPYPPACDKQGPVQCVTSTAGRNPSNANNGTSNKGSGSGNGNGGGSGGSGAGNGSGNGDGTGAGTGAGSADGSGGTGAVDPDTGQVLAGGASNDASSGDISAVPVSLGTDYVGTNRTALMVLAAVLLLMLALVPPFLARGLIGRNR